MSPGYKVLTNDLLYIVQVHYQKDHNTHIFAVFLFVVVHHAHLSVLTHIVYVIL